MDGILIKLADAAYAIRSTSHDMQKPELIAHTWKAETVNTNGSMRYVAEAELIGATVSHRGAGLWRGYLGDGAYVNANTGEAPALSVEIIPVAKPKTRGATEVRWSHNGRFGQWEKYRIGKGWIAA